MRIAIVGAGIAGLTAALALARNGREITLLERRTGFGEPGAGIQLSPNASRVLIDLGLGASLRRLGSTPERVVIRRLSGGREIGSVRLGSHLERRFGAPYWSIARADLHTALLDAVRSQPNIRLRVGRAAGRVAVRADAVEVGVDSAGGSETLEADLLIGADGLRSAIRAALGDRRAPVPSGFAAARAVVPTAALPPSLPPGETGLWLGSGRHVVHYPIGGSSLVNIVVIERREVAGDGWSEPEPGEAVRARFAEVPEPLRDLLATAESWSVWSLADLPVGRMAFGRAVLIGDAAHPVLPFLAQGGALAIEDAAELAARLSGAREVAGALRGFAAARRRRLRRVQAEARRNGRVYHLSAPLAALRDAAIRRAGPEGMSERYAWLYGWRPSPAPG